MSSAQKIVFLVSEYQYFYQHWSALARAAAGAGAAVTVLTDTGGGGQAALAGVDVIDVKLARGVRPLRDLWAAVRVWRVLRRRRPDVMQNVSLKAALAGGFAALLAGAPLVVNVVPGFGFFASRAVGARVLSWLLSPLIRFLFTRRGCVAVLQNRHDYGRTRELTGGRGAAVLIRGVGVDLDRFRPTAEPGGAGRVVLLPARMLWAKGVGEFVAAARELKRRDSRIRMVMAGKMDPANPDAVSERDISGWAREGAVEYWGERRDMEAVYRAAHIVCLPTAYGEGLPTVLLEAAAAGRAVIAGDVPGCREVIADGENGVIIPPRDSAALAQAILALARDDGRRERYRLAGRETVVKEFSQATVNAAYLALYRGRHTAS